MTFLNSFIIILRVFYTLNFYINYCIYIYKVSMISKRNIGVGCADISQKEKDYVNEVLDSERLSYGKFISTFEKKFAEAHGSKHAIMVNSGTSALRIAVACLKEACGWREGDEVLVPAVTFIATSNVVIDHGLKPVFVDVDSKTYNIDPSKIAEKITPKTRAIMVVHLFGQPAEIDPILEIAKKHNLKIIEDSCETMFVKYKGKPVGSFGDISCFSTYVAHLLVTGVGGLALTNNDEYAVIIKSLANHGRDNIYLHIGDDKNLDKEKLSAVVARRFHFIRLGYSFRTTEMEGALGLGQLERKDEILAGRQKNAAYLTEHLKKHEKYLQLPLHPDYIEHAFMMYPIVIKDETIKKSDLVMFLEERGVETRDMLPLLNQPIYIKLFGNLEDKYPVAKWINNNGFYIGCHQKLNKEDLDYIVQIFDEYFKAHKTTN